MYLNENHYANRWNGFDDSFRICRYAFLLAVDLRISASSGQQNNLFKLLNITYEWIDDHKYVWWLASVLKRNINRNICSP